MYRYLPLIATLIEGNPISLGFERPIETFIFELLLFSISSFAFYLSANLKYKNNALQKILNKNNFFDTNPKIIWLLGSIGFLVRLYIFSAGQSEYGNVGGKFLDGILYLYYAPLILFFPKLIGQEGYGYKKLVWIYFVIIFIVNLASNSRAAMIAPIGVCFLLFFLFLVKNNLKIKEIISPRLLLVLVFLVVFGLDMLSDMSYAMLYNRSIRSDVSKTELLQKTLKTYNNKKLLEQIKFDRKERSNEVSSYSLGWTEKYIDNFMLNRYANMRISDETLYHANRLGYGSEKLQTDFWNQLILVFPSPFLNFFGVKFNKESNKYSRGDLLSGGTLGNFVVTSHVGDGLATFSYFYFPIQFILNILVFYLLNTFVYIKAYKVHYSLFGLMNAFVFLGMFRNANGILIDFGYCVRYYWQSVITYIIIYRIVKLIKKII
ncbi:hypothetical protein KO506_02860 [Polaribacter vadi]|uniref:hypothetical protein n=1 Tax=Polaribacter TaxID=52959 RepID=UPI001C08C246|nr:MULTISPECIES: hypothetical protein [Polaribacter]MBU3010333.1 hypothetical protein [Polaribacter vadi]MDO6740140.1 hypothetical protein [Polaribacter sp. 1_MG-2023]